MFDSIEVPILEPISRGKIYCRCRQVTTCRDQLVHDTGPARDTIQKTDVLLVCPSRMYAELMLRLRSSRTSFALGFFPYRTVMVAQVMERIVMF